MRVGFIFFILANYRYSQEENNYYKLYSYIPDPTERGRGILFVMRIPSAYISRSLFSWGIFLTNE